MKRLLVLLLSLNLFVIPTLVSAQSPTSTDLMQQANQLYEESKFYDASLIYQDLVDQGFEDGALFYNLGNAYFKQEDWGRAILNYRRAQRLLPRDSDIQTNLYFARLQTADQIEGDSQVFSQIFRLSERWLTLNETAIITLTLWFVLVIVAVIFAQLRSQTWKQWFSYLLVITSVCLIFGILSLGGRLYFENTSPDGVIVANEVNIMSGPGSQYVVEFTLHSGAEISVLEERANWMRITLPGGQLQGWVESSTVVSISDL
ncbi:MAG: SH3 domain-containing protein [Chloroflexota bacterium]